VWRRAARILQNFVAGRFFEYSCLGGGGAKAGPSAVDFIGDLLALTLLKRGCGQEKARNLAGSADCTAASGEDRGRKGRK